MSEPKKIDDGGSAFPSCDSQGNGPGGMTVREYFAAKALQGLCAQIGNTPCPVSRLADIDAWRRELKEQEAKYCVAMADALIAALKL